MNPTMPAITEKQFMAAVVEYAKRLGYFVFHPLAMKGSEAGYPDLTLIHMKKERIIWIECKSEAGRLTKEQKLWLGAIEDAGGEVYIFRPSDMDRILEILR